MKIDYLYRHKEFKKALEKELDRLIEGKVLSQFAPKMMTEEEIEATIAGVLSDLSIENPTKKEKGKIMKTLMPMVKGKADGKLVNQILEKKLA